MVITSRDVIFAENEKWEWGESNVGLENDVLEWGDEQAVRTLDGPEIIENAEEEESEFIATGNEEVKGSSAECTDTECEAAEGPSDGIRGRNRREPLWMQDYVLEEDSIADDGNLAMFTANEDPVAFEEAVKG